MDRIRNAAIILLGLGEKNAADILKNMNAKEVRAILNAINTIDSVTDDDVIQALNEFFKESDGAAGIDVVSKEQIKNSILMTVSTNGLDNIIHGIDNEKDKWIGIINDQPPNILVDLIQEEHPQVITAIVIIIFNYISSDYGTKVIRLLTKNLQNQIFKRMSCMGTMSRVGIESLGNFFETEFNMSSSNSVITLDGIETAANIISYLDTATEQQIMTEITNEDKVIGEKIQDRIFPFHRLAELDKKSLQVLLKEVKNEDLLLALKGVDDRVKDIFMQNMSQKAAEILKDEMDSKGPVKISAVHDAQKRIIRLAKKLDEEEKIVLSSKNSPDVLT